MKRLLIIIISIFMSIILLSSCTATNFTETNKSTEKESEEIMSDTVEIKESVENSSDTEEGQTTEKPTRYDDIIKNTESNIESNTENITESNVNTDTEKPTNVKDYQIIKTKSGYYRLVFDDSSKYSSSSNPDIVGFQIPSWEEFSDKLLKGELTYTEKCSIYWTFPKDQYGFIILDPYVSYKVTHPISHKTFTETWFCGSYFSIDLEFEDYHTEYLFVQISERYSYLLNYDRTFADIDVQEKIIDYEKELSDGSVMTCYNKTVETINNYTTEKYILSNGTKKIFVRKKYDNSINPKIPREIELLGVVDEDKYFKVVNLFDALYALKKDITEDVSDEFIFGIDVEIEERTVE